MTTNHPGSGPGTGGGGRADDGRTRRDASHEDLMRYLDGELADEERRGVEAALAASTELQRELAIYRSLQRDLRSLGEGAGAGPSVWSAVNRRLARPFGWVLLVVGFLGWSGFGIWIFATSAANPVEKLSVGALLIGFLILLGSAIFERSREWKSDPYRDIER
ncbi:MAG: hypothetical protein RQ751_09645 [Longimicrobiales bacterium]|nr:hypothetical protein [Longimicrobiales bacterium]